MFARLDPVLLPGAVLCVYGPFRYDERYTSGSNREFDRLLKERDPRSGLREIAMVTALAARYGIRLRIDHGLAGEQPAAGVRQGVIFRRKAASSERSSRFSA